MGNKIPFITYYYIGGEKSLKNNFILKEKRKKERRFKSMKKINRWMLLIISTLLFFGGCKNQDHGNGNLEPITPTEKDNTIEYTILEKENFSEVMEQAMEDYQSQRGYKAWIEKKDNKRKTLVLIGAGEKPTGGYDLEILEVKKGKIDEEVLITVKEIEPKETDDVTTALTYPYIVLELQGEFTHLMVQTEKGDPIPVFQEVEKPSKESKEETSLHSEKLQTTTVEAVFTGGIDNNSFEAEVNNEPQAFRIEKFEGELPELNPGDHIKIMYIENEHGQLMVQGIEKL